MLFPDREILFGFLIPIKVKYFVLIIGAVAFLSSFGVNNGVSNFAHLGGLLFGYLLPEDAAHAVRSGCARSGASIGTGSCNAPRRNFRCTCARQGSGRGPKVN